MSALHPKNAAQKERLLRAEHWLCMERARFYTEAHRETEGQPPSLRAARALERILEKMTVRIRHKLAVSMKAKPRDATDAGDLLSSHSMLSHSHIVRAVTVLVLAAPFSFAACSGSEGESAPVTTPENEGGSSAEVDGAAGTEAGASPSAGIPAPTACPTAKFKTLVVVGDSISDVGAGSGSEGPFYRALLLNNDDTKYPEWKGFDLATCWGLAAANVVKVSKGGAVATIPSPNSPTNRGILLNQVTSLPATLEGPVLVVGTIGGNDVQSGLVTVLTGTKAQVAAQIAAFAAGAEAALAELTKADRFGAGVKVEVLLTNVYDPSGGTGHFYYEPSAADCPGALGFWPEKRETRTALEPWNAALAAEVAKHPNVKLLDLAAPFVAHAVDTPAATNWFYKDCIHPSSLGHHATRGVFWEGMRSLP